MPKGVYKKTEAHRLAISKAKKGCTTWNKGMKGKQVAWNKDLEGYMLGEKNGMWKGGISYKGYREKLAGREKPEHCEVCGKKGIICFDHDHVTGKFRGWICNRCNVALGQVKDNIDTLHKLINYLNVFNNDSNKKDSESK